MCGIVVDMRKWQKVAVTAFTSATNVRVSAPTHLDICGRERAAAHDGELAVCDVQGRKRRGQHRIQEADVCHRVS